MDEKYQVFIKVDEKHRLVDINSSMFLTNMDGWEWIDEGWGDRYMHAQGNYLPRPIMTDEGAWRYKYTDGRIVERTPEEIAQDIPAEDDSNLDQRVDVLEEALDMILTGVTE